MRIDVVGVQPVAGGTSSAGYRFSVNGKSSAIGQCADVNTQLVGLRGKPSAIWCGLT
jgi:hypothetical protein